MNIPVDGLIVRCSGIISNESSITGESEDIIKDTYDNCKLR